MSDKKEPPTVSVQFIIFFIHCIFKNSYYQPLVLISPQPKWFKQQNTDAEQHCISEMKEWKTTFPVLTQ